MGCANSLGEGALEGLDLGAADVLAAVQHPKHCLIEVLPEIRELLAETEGGHLHARHLKPGSRTTAVLVRDAI